MSFPNFHLYFNQNFKIIEDYLYADKTSEKTVDLAIRELANFSVHQLMQLSEQQKERLCFVLQTLVRQNEKEEAKEVDVQDSLSALENTVEQFVKPLLAHLVQVFNDPNLPKTNSPINQQGFLNESQAATKIQKAFRYHQRKKIKKIHLASSVKQVNQSDSKKNKNLHGNKFQGVEQVKACILAHQKLLPNVFVPDHFGITHESVLNFLNLYDPDILEKWNEINQKFSNVNDRLKFLNDQEQELANIRKKIESLFNTHYATFSQQYLKEWLTDRQASFLMIRSDSMEDSDDLSNAGGNLSERYVSSSNYQEILSSCGRVVASYFGEDSLRNQIHAGKNPFESIPQLSVVLHELIGENPLTPELISPEQQLNEDIPISAVLFTNEPDFTGNDNRFKVMTISCGYGHGEGVVGSCGINTDTIYITESLTKKNNVVLYQNNHKSNRLAPVNKNGIIDLELVENSQSASMKKALDQKMVERLYQLGRLVEEQMEKPQDIELIIKGNNIYVVQMRDIKRKPLEGRYLEIPEKAVAKNLAIKTLVSGNNPVVQIDHPDQILSGKTLKKALKEYNPAQHRVILVSEDEPSKNSHPIVIARELGVPAFYAPKKELNKIIPLVNADFSLIVDQSDDEAQLLLWKNEIALQDNLKPGFLTHPAHMTISVGKKYVRKNAIYKHEMPSDLKLLIRSLKTAKTQEAAEEALTQLQLKTLLPLRDRINKLSSIIEEIGKINPTAQSQLNILQRLEKKIDQVFTEIETAYHLETPPLAKLFHIKTLSTLICNNDEKTLNSFSLLDMESLAQQIERICQYENKLASKSKFSDLLHLGEYGVSNQENQEWEQFLLELEALPPEESVIQQFKEMVHVLEEQEALPVWLNLIAIPLIRESFKGDALRILIEEYQSNAKEIQMLFDLTKAVKSIEGILPNFSNPKKFESAFHQLELLSKKFNEPLPFDTSLLKIVLGSVLERYSTFLDEAIKTMKASDSFSDEEKIQLLFRMLSVNFKTMKQWLKHFAILFAREQLKKGKEYSDWRKENAEFQKKRAETEINFYIHTLSKKCWKEIKGKLMDIKNRALLDPSLHFNVAAGIINVEGRRAFQRHLPQTLEDFFTLIHQNQMEIISKIHYSLLENNIWVSMNLPSFFRETIDACNESVIQWNKTSLRRTNFKITKQSLVVYYNKQLGVHSMSLDFELNRKQEIIIHVKFLGIRIQRWMHLDRLADAVNRSNLIVIKDSWLTDQGIQFKMHINNDTNLQYLRQILKGMISIAEYSSAHTAISNFDNPQLISEVLKNLD